MGAWQYNRATIPREKDSPLNYCAPYRVLVSVSTGGSTVYDAESDAPGCRYIVVEDDSDAHVRKPGEILVEETRYESRLDVKVAELARVFCSKEFMADICSILSDDEDFCKGLFTAWQLELSLPLLYLYRILVLYRQPLVRTDSGYHVPSSEEVIAGIKAYFDPTTTYTNLVERLMGDVANIAEKLKIADNFVLKMPGIVFGTESFSSRLYQQIRHPEASMALSLTAYLEMFVGKDDSVVTMATVIDSGYSQPLPSRFLSSHEAMQLMAGARSAEQLSLLHGEFAAMGGTELFRMLMHALSALDLSSSASNNTSYSQCPYIFFFAKYCLEQGLTVPGPLLAAYNNMCGQLSCSHPH